jgi:hypothetical protein
MLLSLARGQNSTPSRGRPSRGRTNFRGQNNNRFARARSPPKPNEGTTEYKCHWCQKPGHMWRQCFSLKNQIQKIRAFHADKNVSIFGESDEEDESDSEEEQKVFSMMNDPTKSIEDFEEMIETFGCGPGSEVN